MPTTNSGPVIDEPQIWNAYLLPPSPLPTILPFSTFVNLVPATYRNNSEYALALKQIYRDLQLQRAITIEQVRDNISRECGQRATLLRANLTRKVAIEEGDKLAAKQHVAITKKRKRDEQRNRQRANADESSSGDEEAYSSDFDEFTDPQRLAVNQAMYNDPSNSHPAAHVLPFIDGNVKFQNAEMYHTKQSLLQGMAETESLLEAEINELERECTDIKVKLNETIGGLSDLRYGKRQSDADTSNHADILQAIQNFKTVLSSNSTGDMEILS